MAEAETVGDRSGRLTCLAPRLDCASPAGVLFEVYGTAHHSPPEDLVDRRELRCDPVEALHIAGWAPIRTPRCSCGCTAVDTGAATRASALVFVVVASPAPRVRAGLVSHGCSLWGSRCRCSRVGRSAGQSLEASPRAMRAAVSLRIKSGSGRVPKWLTDRFGRASIAWAISSRS